jgi:hypothetical protein
MNIYLMENKSTMPYPTTDGRQQESASTTVAHKLLQPNNNLYEMSMVKTKKN